ncbi:MAG: pilus assembly protein TadG-related protein [Pseudomonadota bacterium]
MITGVIAMVLIGVSGAAIDMSGASNLRSSYQDMADSAVLSAARSKKKTQADMAKMAQATVDSMNATGTTPKVTTTLSSDKKFLQVQLEGSYDNFFMGIFGSETVGVTGFAETVIEMTENAEIVLVLDTTNSMKYESRMDSLKTAAKNFINIMEDVDVDNRIRIGVVPYGQYVNVGLSQRSEPWLDVPPDWIETFPQQCNMVRGPKTGQTCRNGVTQPTPGTPAQPYRAATPPTYGTCTDDGVSYRCQTSPGSPARQAQPARPGNPGGQPTRICTDTFGPDVRQCTTPAPVHHKWHGCVGSRRNSANVDVDYSNGEAKVPGFLDLTCGAEILQLTNDFSKVKKKVRDLTTNGETYSAAGLIWGHRMVDYAAPFPLKRRTPGVDPRRIVIFMTDGFNTRSRNGDRHDGTDRSDADRTAKTICDGMKADPELEVYTVSFKVIDNQAKRLIKGCASQDEMYYEASNAGKLNEAFEDIAYSLLTPRLTQ